LKYEDLIEALKKLNITPPITIKELKERYRKRIKEAKNDEEIMEMNRSYKVLIDFMENYPFRISREEFLLSYPEERLMERFFGEIRKR
jgi:deoxyribodipyrimidine photolyase-like uncharacterized protein